MEEHRRILTRVGWLLVVVGLADVGLMVYCIINRINYSSSLNIFAVVAGIYLLRGHLGAVRVVTWFSAFMLTGLGLAVVVLFPQAQPFDYWLQVLHKRPLSVIEGLVWAVAGLGMLFWIYSQLRKPPVVAARVAAGQKAEPPASAFIAGVLLALGMAIIWRSMMGGEMAEKAVRLAVEKHGADYKYFVTSISWSGTHGSAGLVAYNDKEEKQVEVEWKE